jgi:parallel beta-helix repeat protein
MSEQKNKLVIVITLAIVSALLLGGVSFTFFPSQFSSTPKLTAPTLNLQEFTPATNSSFPILGVYSINSSLSSANSYPLGGLAYVVFAALPLDGITIEQDGSINSTTAPIMRSGNVYALTGDITNQTIMVNRSNIVIDGAGYSLQGWNDGYAYALENFDLQDVHDVTIKNFNISLSWQGIWIQNCSNIVIENNVLSNINTGIDANAANNTLVTGNSLNNLTTAIGYTSWYGFGPSVNNIISKNNITNAMEGIQLNFANSNTVTDNIIVNAYDPIYAGNNSVVARNTLINGIDAIGVCSYNTVYDNVISGFSDSGLLLIGANSTIYQNTIANCTNVVAVDGSSGSYSLGNLLYHNNFLNNSQSILLMDNSSVPINFWDNGKEGNYWSSYNGTDSNADGIGDTSYQIGDNNTDLYPLMQPYITQVNSYDHVTAQIFFTLAGITAAGGVFIALTWAYFGKRTIKKKLRSLNH